MNLRMGDEGHIDDSLVGNGVTMLHVAAENSLEKYDTADRDVQTWLQEVTGALARDDVALPVLVHCRAGKDRTGVVVAALLLLLGLPEDLVVKEFLLSEGAEEKNIRLSIAGFQKSGGVGAYLSTRGSVDVESLRLKLLGAVSAEEQAAAEMKWLQQEVPMMCGLARTSAALEPEESAYWSGEVVKASLVLASHALPAEAAAAFYCQGWALGQLQRDDEACEALSVGVALARRGEAKGQVLKKLEKEMALHGEALCVVAAAEASDTPGDPHVGLLVLSSSLHQPWRALRCPEAFSWLRCGELALSATPQRKHLPALECLGLSGRICSEQLGVPRPPEEHLEETVGQVAQVLSKGAGCLVHCTDGFGASGVLGACFLVQYGLDLPVKSKAPGQPQMSAGEALELLRQWRPGSLASAEEQEQVHQFALAAWARHVQKAQRAFSGSAPSRVEKKVALGAARVVAQPPDGSCLFHSLAYALGSTATNLRGEMCSFMEKNPELTIAGTSLANWIQMLAGVPVAQYVKKMSKGSTWGGAPEIAACAHMKKVNIHIYERKNGSFELTVPFEVGGARTVSVLYVGGVHYDALVLS